MESIYREGIAIPFIEYDTNLEKFILNLDSEKIIKEFNDQFGVVSIIGNSCTGKSFLLNKMLLQYKNGFKVGKNKEPNVKKGIWIWSKPLLGYDMEGKTMQILMMDTQGFGNEDKNSPIDSKIYILSMLLSSLLIYNSIGQIDDHVINSLNFITKLRSVSFQKNEESCDDSVEDLQQKKINIKETYPDLLWILRDFSFQNLPENDPDFNILPNEYLEKKLQIQKRKNNNLSMVMIENDKDNTIIEASVMEEEEESICVFGSTELSTKINKKIKKFFSKRDLFTLINPLAEENINTNILENNDKDYSAIPDEKLRPEFLAQVLSLRKKIIENCKIKTFNGIKLSPEFFMRIVMEYLEAINSGDLPDLNLIWNKLCDWENQKAVSEAENVYKEVVKRNIERKRTIGAAELNQLHGEAKIKSMEIFKRKSIGDFSTGVKKLLKKKIEDNLTEFSTKNEEENKNEIVIFLKNQFNKTDIKLNNNEINSMEEIQKEIAEIENKIIKNFPNTNSRDELIADFKIKFLVFTTNHIINKQKKEFGNLKEKFQEEEKNLNKEKSLIEKEIFDKKEKEKKFEEEKISLREEINKFEIKFSTLEIQKEKIIKEYEEKISKNKEENSKNIFDLQEKIALLEKKNLESELKLYEIRENCEKEKASMIIKIEYLTKSVDEFNKKEKEFNSEIDLKLKETNLFNKTTLDNYEKQISDLNLKISEFKEKNSDLEISLNSKEHNLEIIKSKLDDLQQKSLIEKNELNTKAQNLKNNFDSFKTKANIEIEEKENKIEELEKKIRNEEENYFAKISQTEENLKSQIKKMEKDLSLLKQEKHFIEVKYEESQNSLLEQKKQNENMLKNMENKVMEDHNEQNYKINEVKKSFENEKKILEENFEKNLRNKDKEIERLNEKINSNEISLRKNNKDAEDKMKEANDLNEKLKLDIINLNKSKVNLEEEHLRNIDDMNNKNNKLLKDHERKIEDKEKSHKKEIENFNKNYDENISHYKSLFETERIRLEEKVKDEKTRFDKKLKNFQEENEAKIRDMEKERQNELSHIKDEWEESVQNYQNIIIKLEMEIKTLNQKIQNLEGNLKEAKDSLNKAQIEFNANLEKKNENFNKERKEFLCKIENLNINCNNRDKEITNLKLNKDSLENEIRNLEKRNKLEKENYENIISEIKDEKEFCENKIQEQQDEYNMNKLELERQGELFKQQIEFLNKKLDEQIKMKDLQDENLDEIIMNMRNQIHEDFENLIENLKKEKEDLSNKISNKKKELRDLEQAFLKQTCIHEKEKETLNEKINNFDIKKKEMIDFYKKSIEMINKETIGMREDFEKEINELKEENEKLMEKLNEADRENNTNHSNKAFLKTKVGNLENQIEDNKKFMAEVQKKFDNILNNQTAKANAEKEKIQIELNTKLLDQKSHYEELLREMEDEFNRKIIEISKENEELENELNILSKQTQANLKASDPDKISKRISELLSQQNKLQKDLDNSKSEKEKALNDLNSAFSKERDSFSLKILELELALKEYEQLGYSKTREGSYLNNNNPNSTKFSSNNNNINSGSMEFEKEKIKWNSEKENLKKNINGLNQKVEHLIRENDNLKLKYLEQNHSPIHNYRTTNNTNNSFLKKTSRQNSIIGNNVNDNSNLNINNNNQPQNKNQKGLNLNMQMNMNSPMGRPEPNLFSDNSEIGEYNMCYDITSPHLNISPDKNNDYYNFTSKNKANHYSKMPMSYNPLTAKSKK